MNRDEFGGLSNAAMAKHLHERFCVPLGTAKGKSKSALLDTYDTCMRNEETHEAIARAASKASF